MTIRIPQHKPEDKPLVKIHPKPEYEPLVGIIPKREYEPLLIMKEKQECRTFIKEDKEFDICGNFPNHMIKILTKEMGWKEKEE